jgi:hypothetical protein
MQYVLIGALYVVVLLTLGSTVWTIVRLRAHAKAFGYPSTWAYLHAAPRSDREKREAVNLATSGMVLCLLGLLFPPVIVLGVFPLFVGFRKLAYASLGLGLFEDADSRG